MKRIGIVTTEQYKPFQMQIIEGIQAVTGQECELVIDSLGEDPTMRKDFSLDTRLLDGLIVIADVLADDTILSLHAEGIPMTLVSHLLDDARIPSVIQNNIDGMTQLMNYMIADCQRRNLVFIQGNLAQGDSRERLSLFQAGMMRHDLSPDDALYIEGNGDPVIAGNAILELLDSDTSFDGIVASDYLMGCAVLDILRFYNVRIPRDVSVMAFGDGTEAIELGLTVVGVNLIDLGQRSARQLLGQIDGIRFSGVTWLNTELIVRDSS